MTTNGLLKICVLFIWVGAIFDPAGSIYGLKYIGLSLFGVSLLFMVAANSINFGLGAYKYIIFFVFFFFMQVFGLFVGGVHGSLSYFFIDTSYIYSSFYILFFLLLNNESRFDFSNNVLMGACVIVATMIYCAWALNTLGFHDWNNFFVSNGLAFISERNYGGVSFPYIYFIVSPILLFALCKFTRDLIIYPSLTGIAKVFFFAVALGLSGTRMNILLSFLSIVITFFWCKWGRIGYLYLVPFLLLIFVVIVVCDFQVVRSAIDSGEISNQTKIGYLSYYYSQLNVLPYFLFGQGFNSHVWSSGLDALLVPGASKLELTYLELIRVFGFPLGVLFLGFFVCVLFSVNFCKKDKNNWIQPASVSFLLVTSLNPYLFSMEGMLIFSTALVYFSGAYKIKS